MLLAAWIISVGVMVFEKDLGTSLLLYASFLVMVYIATDRLSWVVIGLTLFGAGSFVAYHLFGHVRSRVQTWLDPSPTPKVRAISWSSLSSALPPGCIRYRPGQRPAGNGAGRIDGLHHRRGR